MSPAKRFHVLIATDGSTSARAALATAVRFPWPAAARGSAVVAKQVRAEYRRSILLTALDRTAEFTAQKATRAMSARWPDSQARAVDAPPVEGILDEAKRVRADVIVLGWRGHGTLRRLLTGSVSRGVARRGPCSVLVVRRRRLEVRRIVIGLDGSPNAARALKFLAAVPPPRGAHVTLVRVVDAMHVPSQGLAPAGTRRRSPRKYRGSTKSAAPPRARSFREQPRSLHLRVGRAMRSLPRELRFGSCSHSSQRRMRTC